jgi:hypothetical protein
LLLPAACYAHHMMMESALAGLVLVLPQTI